LLTAIRNSLLKLKEYGPATEVLFYLLVLSFLPFAYGIVSGPIRLTDLGGVILLYVILAFPALLAFLLLLRRRPFGLYGALAVFLFWFLTLTGLIGILHEHESSSLLFLWTIIGFGSGWGAIVAFREAAGGKVLMRLLAFVIFFGMEVGTVWIFLVMMNS